MRRSRALRRSLAAVYDSFATLPRFTILPSIVLRFPPQCFTALPSTVPTWRGSPPAISPCLRAVAPPLGYVITRRHLVAPPLRHRADVPWLRPAGGSRFQGDNGGVPVPGSAPRPPGAPGAGRRAEAELEDARMFLPDVCTGAAPPPLPADIGPGPPRLWGQGVTRRGRSRSRGRTNARHSPGHSPGHRGTKGQRDTAGTQRDTAGSPPALPFGLPVHTQPLLPGADELTE